MIDSHCHLDLPSFDGDRQDVLARAAAVGVTGVLVPAIRPSTWTTLLDVAQRHREVRVAIGVHPQVVARLDERERAALGSEVIEKTLHAALDAAGPLAVAVGECGLDGGCELFDEQVRIFSAHVRVARDRKLPLVVHVLRAHDAALRLLRATSAVEVGGVLHSYSGGAAMVPLYANLGFHFSFAGPVTYANARRPLEAARAVPAELLLAETDGPDQAPEPYRGQRSEPARLVEIITALARAQGDDPDGVAALTHANAVRLFARWNQG